MPHFNYFAEREQAGQERFQKWRDDLCGPVVRLLIRCGITADVISLVGILQLLPFGYFLLTADQPSDVAFASLFVWLHVFLDAFDGAIARFTGAAGAAGSFTDMCVDHVGMLITTALLTEAGYVDGTAAVVYVSSYTIAVVFTVWLNVIGEPLRLVIRTKYPLYALVTACGLTGVDVINEAVLAFCVVHVLFSAAGFMKLRRVLGQSGVSAAEPERDRNNDQNNDQNNEPVSAPTVEDA